MTMLPSGLGCPKDVEIFPTMMHLHCVQCARAQGLGQVSSEAGLQTQMPSEARHVKKGRGKKRAMVPHRVHLSSQKDAHRPVIVDCPRES